jgi:formylglycine-generating enzyme required for sulfatase activity
LANVCGKECEIWHRGTGLLLDFAGTMHQEDDGFSGTAPVGQLKAGATPEGALDLAGNVSEWTNDAPSEYPTPASSARSEESAVHMIRGASFASGPVELSEAAFRFAVLNNTHSPSIGFRCAADTIK